MNFLGVITLFIVSVSVSYERGGIMHVNGRLHTKGSIPCSLASGRKGECKSIYRCPQVANSFSSTAPVYCGFFRMMPIVCCPVTRNTSSPVPRRTGYRKLRADENLPIPDIFKQFECGFSPKFLEQHQNGYHFHRKTRSILNRRRKRWVVGGQETEVGEFPWMALVGEKKEGDEKTKWICDGVLIHPDWVITAAHCLLDLSTHVVRLGEHNIESDSEAVQDFVVTQYHFHPDFKLEVNYHDLAMIKLPTPAKITESVSPVCLPWTQIPNLVGSIATLAGWGAEMFGGSLSNVLRDVDVTVFNASVCDKSYSSLRDYNTLWPSGIKSKYLVCAGGEHGGVDSCQGDSGGPLMIKRNDRVELIGIVSKGFGCGLKEFPGIYVAARTYLIWICDIILKDIAG